MKILTICQGGNSRSVGMAFLLKYKYNIDAIACSWEKNSSETLKMLFEWADNILIMESNFEKYIPNEYKHKIRVTDVGEDVWFSIRKDLVDLCDQLLEPFKMGVNMINESEYRNEIKNIVFEIKESPINGLGVFSLKNFKKDDYISIHGIMLENDFEITKFGRYLNHSYTPNAVTKVNLGVYKTYAIKPIKSGDEITLDYRKRKELEQPQKGWK